MCLDKNEALKPIRQFVAFFIPSQEGIYDISEHTNPTRDSLANSAGAACSGPEASQAVSAKTLPVFSAHVLRWFSELVQPSCSCSVGHSAAAGGVNLGSGALLPMTFSAQTQTSHLQGDHSRRCGVSAIDRRSLNDLLGGMPFIPAISGRNPHRTH